MLDYLGQSALNCNPEIEKVEIYVRNAQKQARMFSVNSTLWPQDFVHVVSSKFCIPVERIILFYNGYRIDNYSLSISLTEKSIMHLIDKQNLNGNTINLSFKALFYSPILKCSFPPDTRIGLILSNYLAPQYGIESDRFFMVYAGKTLNPSNTLKDQYVENQAQLIVLKYKSINDSFQKEAIQYNSSYHLQPTILSSLKYTTPVSYQTSIEAIKKKNKMQAGLSQSNNQFLNAGPLPVIKQLQANNDGPNNIPAVHISGPLKSEENTAPHDNKLYKTVFRHLQPKQQTCQPQINILTNTVHSASQQQQLQITTNKAILQLQSHYHDISTTNIEVTPLLNDAQNEKNGQDSFIDQQSASKKDK